MSDLSLNDAIFTTRSMRRLKPDPVPRQDLEYIVEAATMAPSAGNLQLWAFVVVTELETRERIAAAYREAGRAYIRDGVLAHPDTDDDQRRVYSKAMHNVEHLDEAPAIVVACLTVPCPDSAAVASGLFGSVYPAVQNLMLAARSRGLGSMLLTLATDYCPAGLLESPSVREVLGLPDPVRAVALIPVGYPVGTWGRPWRKQWTDCTHWERWTA
jgi:nitroreductase